MPRVPSAPPGKGEIDVPRSARDPVEELASAISAITGAPASTEQRQKFTRYIELLIIWNKTQGLTALRTPGQIVKGLFQDALLFLPLLPPQRPLMVVDLGSGAGIPGVPLRIVDGGIRLTLVEARRKRVSFLSTVRRELALGEVQIIHGRAEAAVSGRPELAGQFDAVVSRATAPPLKLLDLAAPYLKRGGLLVASGPPLGAQRQSLPGDGAAEWREVPYPALGLKRIFLVAVNQS